MDLSNNQTLHFRKTGSGAPVFILHGLFGSEKNWQSIAHRLSENYTVFSLDMRNHGQSFHSDQFNYEARASQLDPELCEWIEKGSLEIAHYPDGKK